MVFVLDTNTASVMVEIKSNVSCLAANTQMVRYAQVNCKLFIMNLLHANQLTDYYRKNSIIIHTIYTIITSLKVGVHIIHMN